MKRKLILAATFSIAATSFGASAQGDYPVFEPVQWKRPHATGTTSEAKRAPAAVASERTQRQNRLADPFAPALNAQ